MAKKLIIAPRSMHQSLIEVENHQDGFYDVKMMTKEELIEDYFGRFDHQAIIETMLAKRINYDSARAIVDILPFIDKKYGIAKLDELFDLRKLLEEKNLLIKNEYLAIALKDKIVEIYSYSPDDYYLNLILKATNQERVSYISNTTSIEGSSIVEFSSIEQEVHTVMNQIASLIDEGKSANDIFLLGVDDAYEYYVERYASLYGIVINGFSTRSLSKTGEARDFLDLCYQNMNIAISIEQYFQNTGNNQTKIALYNAINKCIDKRLDFDMQIDVIKSVLKASAKENEKYKNAIHIISSNNGVKNADIFVLGFRQGAFPKVSKDTDYLLESEKELCGYIKTIDLNKENIYSLVDFLKSQNRFHYSFSRRSISENFYPSFLASEYKFKITNPPLISVDYSLEAASIELSKMFDSRIKYKEISPLEVPYQKAINLTYATYDNSFNGAEVFNSQSLLKLSYSPISSFQKCQFKYFLEQVMKVDEFEENFYNKLGLLSHDLFKNSLRDDFDFISQYDACLAKSTWNDKELTLLVSIKEYLRLACQNIIDHKKTLDGAAYYLETPLSFNLDNKTILKGTIDKIIVTKNKNLYLVDYKTGKESFNPNELEFGFSMQLPTYGLLTSEDERFKDCKLSGLYINHIIDEGIKKTFSDLVTPSYLKLDGQTISDIQSIESIDPNYQKEGPRFVNIPGLLKSGEFPKTPRLAPKETFEDYLKIVKTKYIESNDKIRQNDFRINPKLIKKKSSCEYCTYKDICYVRKSQQVILIKEESEEDEVE